MLRVHALLTREMDADLRARHGISLSAYELLMLLADAPGRRMRVSELAGATLLSVSGISRLVDRLVREGLVVKESCDEDGRGAEVALTTMGRGRVRAARASHLADVRGRFLSRFDDDELARAGGVLGPRGGRGRRRLKWRSTGEAPDNPSRRAEAGVPAQRAPVVRRGRVAADRSRDPSCTLAAGEGLRSRDPAVTDCETRRRRGPGLSARAAGSRRPASVTGARARRACPRSPARAGRCGRSPPRPGAAAA